jgi:hypothetical protein
MLKRLFALGLAVACLSLTGCFCEKPCYGCSFRRDARQITDCLNLHLLNYDKNDPYRCDPCAGD